MKPSKLMRHLEKKHPNHATKSLEFFWCHEASLKHQRPILPEGFTGIIWSRTWNCQAKKTHTIGETLVKPWLLKTVELLPVEASEANMRRISLSKETIQRRISDMPEDMNDQAINESISSVFFSSGWVNRCYFMCSVVCFREIYSFRRH